MPSVRALKPCQLQLRETGATPWRNKRQQASRMPTCQWKTAWWSCGNMQPTYKVRTSLAKSASDPSRMSHLTLWPKLYAGVVQPIIQALLEHCPPNPQQVPRPYRISAWSLLCSQAQAEWRPVTGSAGAISADTRASRRSSLSSTCLQHTQR